MSRTSQRCLPVDVQALMGPRWMLEIMLATGTVAQHRVRATHHFASSVRPRADVPSRTIRNAQRIAEACPEADSLYQYQQMQALNTQTRPFEHVSRKKLSICLRVHCPDVCVDGADSRGDCDWYL